MKKKIMPFALSAVMVAGVIGVAGCSGSSTGGGEYDGFRNNNSGGRFYYCKSV